MAFFRRKSSRRHNESSASTNIIGNTQPNHNTTTLIRSNSDEGGDIQFKTPPGYNKNLRDFARYLLAACTVCMILGEPKTALVFSIAAIVTMYHGTIQSIKNIAWGIMVWISFPACLWAAFLRLMIIDVDEDRAYGLVVVLKILGRGTEVFFGFFSGVILLLTALGKIGNQEI